MTLKMKQLFILLLILTINLLVQHCNGGSEVWGKAEVSGRVVDTNGNAVSGVTVKLYPNNGKLLEESSAFVKPTNKNGEYSFGDVPSGSYVVQGIDSLSGSVVEFLRRNVDHDTSKGRTDLKNDTLKFPGKLCVILKNAPGKFDGKTGYLPGTPYFSFANNDTLRLLNVACGKYICKFEQVEGYAPVVSDSFPIVSDSQTTIKIDLKIDPDGPPPAPKNLISAGIIDTALGKVILKWDSVKVSDLKGYVVFGGIKKESLPKVHSTSGSTIDTVDMVVDTTGKEIVNYFQVFASDTLNDTSSGSNIISVTAPSPKVVKTQISKTIVSTHAPKLFIGDTARIIVTLKNTGRIIDSVTWALGRSDSIVKIVRFKGDTTHQCSDTMIMVWKDSSTKTLYISAYDNSGSKDSIVERIYGSGMYPPNTWLIYPARLPTPRWFLDLISDGVSIYSVGGYRTSLNLQNLQQKRTTYDLIEFFSPDLNSPFKSAKLKSARYNHSSFLYNKKIYSIGGTTGNSLEMYDPVSQQSSIVGTLPYTRHGSTVSVVGDKCYLVGGTIADTLTPQEGVVTGSIDFFIIPAVAQGKLEIGHKGDLMTPRSSHSAIMHDNKIVVLGGVDTSSAYTTADVEMFDLTSGLHEKLPELNKPRCHFSAVELSGQIYVFGGYVADNEYLDVVEKLDLSNPVSWTSVTTPMTKARYGMAAVVHNGKVFMMGGAVVNSNGSIEADTTVNVYYP
jgi:hypothetical protein